MNCSRITTPHESGPSRWRSKSAITADGCPGFQGRSEFLHRKTIDDGLKYVASISANIVCPRRTSWEAATAMMEKAQAEIHRGIGLATGMNGAAASRGCGFFLEKIERFYR